MQLGIKWCSNVLLLLLILNRLFNQVAVSLGLGYSPFRCLTFSCNWVNPGLTQISDVCAFLGVNKKGLNTFEILFISNDIVFKFPKVYFILSYMSRNLCQKQRTQKNYQAAHRLGNADIDQCNVLWIMTERLYDCFEDHGAVSVQLPCTQHKSSK